jgi:hypothetical protein
MTGPLDPGAPILYGRDYNFFQKLSVTNVSAFNTNADMIITFSTQTVMFLNVGSGVIEYSFNGNTVHGELNSANLSAGKSFDNRVISKIWFRVQAGSVAPITVAVEAWGIR